MLDTIKEIFPHEIAIHIFKFCSHQHADIIRKALEDGEKLVICNTCKNRCTCCLICDMCNQDIDFIINDMWHIICFNCNRDKNITFLLDLFNIYYINGKQHVVCKKCQDTILNQ